MTWKESKKTVVCVYKNKRGICKKKVSLCDKLWENIVPFLKKLKDTDKIPNEVIICYQTEMPDFMSVVIDSSKKFDKLIETAERLSKEYE